SHLREIRLGHSLLLLRGCAVVHPRSRLLFFLFTLCAGLLWRCTLGLGLKEGAKFDASLLGVSLGVCQLLLQGISDQSGDLLVVQSGLELDLEPVILCLKLTVRRTGALLLRAEITVAVLQRFLLVPKVKDELFRLSGVKLFAVLLPWHLAIVFWHCILLGCCTGRKALLRPTELSYTSPLPGNAGKRSLPVPAPDLDHVDPRLAPEPGVIPLHGLPRSVDPVGVLLHLRLTGEHRDEYAPTMVVRLRRQLAGQDRRRHLVLLEPGVDELERVRFVDGAAGLQHRAEVAGVGALGDPGPADR